MTAALVESARRETEWARALAVLLERHGPTPVFDSVVRDLGYEPEREA